MKYIVFMVVSTILITSCRSWDPLFDNYLDAEGEWNIEILVINDNNVSDTLKDINSTVVFNQCLEKREIKYDECTAIQFYNSDFKTLDYNFSSSVVSFGFEGNDLSIFPDYFIGLASVWDIVSLDDDFFVITTDQFFIKEGNGESYDEVTMILKRK